MLSGRGCVLFVHRTKVPGQLRVLMYILSACIVMLFPRRRLCYILYPLTIVGQQLFQHDAHRVSLGTDANLWKNPNLQPVWVPTLNLACAGFSTLTSRKSGVEFTCILVLSYAKIERKEDMPPTFYFLEKRTSLLLLFVFFSQSQSLYAIILST